MTIFEALRKDHDIQRKLVDQLVETHGDSSQRDKLFNQLKVELQVHATAEERCFYVPLMQHDNTQEKARHGVAEHHEFDELIETLESTDYSSPGWLAAAKHLHERLHHHLDEEEHEFFQIAGKVMTTAEKSSLGDDYQEEIDDQRSKAA
ncbi:hemerythrin domain-containing protein [Pokkaliibacter sp. CJK22405]|uniref:hemerythrin domain-containing protein n=1 Tax=Pokkaliibacter sp. CJK22405 TaxID=3384615 RepID=UPI003984679B